MSKKDTNTATKGKQATEQEKLEKKLVQAQTSVEILKEREMLQQNGYYRQLKLAHLQNLSSILEGGLLKISQQLNSISQQIYDMNKVMAEDIGKDVEEGGGEETDEGEEEESE